MATPLISKPAPTGAAALEYLNAAVEIGRRITRDAVWHEDRCNWIGAEPQAQTGNVVHGLTYRTLGPDAYSGTSGTGLFLAELAAITGDPEARRTAVGAIRHALARADAIRTSVRLGLFSGWTGIAWIAARAAMILGEPALLDEARALLHRTTTEDCETREFDLMSGRAGAIVALGALRDLLDDAALLDFAVRLGDELIESAEAAEFGLSWQSPGLVNFRNLTGFSHGSAGAGYGLLELFQATGVSEYRDAALRAFEYERHWFRLDEGNWPDFRKDASAPSKKRRHPCLSFWCHGAPGIALSRLRAWEILEDATCLEEATVALKTTREAIESALDTWTGNFSMCHGLAGNADILLSANDPEDTALVQRVAQYGIERYSGQGKAPWPCGTHSGETPNLMLGLAGIGLFYLRLAKPRVPTILAPSSQANHVC